MVTSALIYWRLKVGAANFLVHQWIEQQSSSFFAEGIEKLVPRWDKCLNVRYSEAMSRNRNYCSMQGLHTV